MATWHQQQRSVQLWHESLWTVVEDRGHTTISRFETNVQAQAYMNSLSRCGNNKGAYLLPPQQAMMRK